MRVWVTIPDRWDGLVKKAMELEGWEKETDYIRELIKNDLKAKGLLGVRAENGREKEAVVVEG